MSRYALLAAASAVAIAAPASADLLYSNNYDAPAVVAAGVGVVGPTNSAPTAAAAGAWNASGWAGLYGDNRTPGNPAAPTTLTFSNLPSHSQISVSFLLGLLESWDSTNGNPSPDFFRVQADGVDLVSDITVNNASGSNSFYDGGTQLFKGVQLNPNAGFSDTLVNMGTAGDLTFAHTASTLTLSFQAYGAGWQGGDDEGWGIDNLVVNFTPAAVGGVPEPAAWALMIAGFGLAGAAVRRRKVALA
jgi:hypothetical protein